MVSVCMATYNGEKYIREQLNSILCQLGDEDELVISDDSSTDRTVRIIEEMHDPRVHLLHGNHFASPIYNLENALKHCRGDFIFLADQDDVWMKDKVSVMMRYLPKYDCVVSDAIVVDRDLNVLYDSFFAYRKSGPGLLKNLFKNRYMGCSMAFTRAVLEKTLPFPRDLPMHDSWIGLIAEMTGKTIFIDDKLILYRRHGRNVSNIGQPSNLTYTARIWNRVHLMQNLRRRMRLLRRRQEPKS